MAKFLSALLVSFFIAVIVAPLIIKLTKRLKFGQNILHYVESHTQKQGTPTMGGIIFIFSTIASSVIFFDASFHFALMCLALFFGFAVLGFLDDFIKIKCKRNLGLRPYQKIIGQVGLALIIAVYAYTNSMIEGIYLPFSDILIRLSWFMIPYTIIVILATSNSVNLTDGLDGLAGGVSAVYFIGFGILLSLFATSGLITSDYALQLNNIIIVCGAMAGGLIGFLCFNSYKAKIFMGDTGSMAIGALVGAVGILSSYSLYIIILGVMYVVSSLSVIIQVLHYKRTKRRIFLMAPLHHHFEKKGCNESKIVTIYIIITTIIAIGCILINIIR